MRIIRDVPIIRVLIDKLRLHQLNRLVPIAHNPAIMSTRFVLSRLSSPLLLDWPLLALTLSVDHDGPFGFLLNTVRQLFRHTKLIRHRLPERLVSRADRVLLICRSDWVLLRLIINEQSWRLTQQRIMYLLGLPCQSSLLRAQFRPQVYMRLILRFIFEHQGRPLP